MNQKIAELLALVTLQFSPVAAPVAQPFPEAGIPKLPAIVEMQPLTPVVEVEFAEKAVYVAPTYPDSKGNEYTLGNCTWYVKSKRPDLPNSLGNANTWYIRAKALGVPTGVIPRVGSVAVDEGGKLGHVMYVTAVGNGTITVSEMNYEGLYIVSTRTLPSYGLYYIY